MNTLPRLYSELAWIWPIVSPPEDYGPEAMEFRQLIEKHSRRRARSLLNLGTGGGHLDHHLRQWYRITGVDRSQAMLAMAQDLNPEVEYLAGDMRHIRMGNHFDAVVLADASDYLLTASDLQATALTAYAHLKPGGVFCTYAEETRETFQQNQTQVGHHTRGGISITAVEHTFDPDPGDTSYELTFVYLIHQEGKLMVEVESHRMGLFPESVWVDTLENGGFEVAMYYYETAGPMFVGVK